MDTSKEVSSMLKVTRAIFGQIIAMHMAHQIHMFDQLSKIQKEIQNKVLPSMSCGLTIYKRFYQYTFVRDKLSILEREGCIY